MGLHQFQLWCFNSPLILPICKKKNLVFIYFHIFLRFNLHPLYLWLSSYGGRISGFNEMFDFALSGFNFKFLFFIFSLIWCWTLMCWKIKMGRIHHADDYAIVFLCNNHHGSSICWGLRPFFNVNLGMFG